MTENTQELVYQGNTLAGELEELLEQYDLRSDEHDILKWEVAIVRARLADLQDHIGLPDDLLDSVLLCDRGYKLAKTIPDLARRVGQFMRTTTRGGLPHNNPGLLLPRPRLRRRHPRHLRTRIMTKTRTRTKTRMTGRRGP